MIKIAPSILAADMLNMQRDVTRMVEAGCDMIHVDIMDAHFVPNLSYGPDMVRALKRAFTTPLDVHLMMDNPEKYIDVFADAGADLMTIHAEIPTDVRSVLESIRARGVKPGLSITPGTPAEAIRDLLPLCDLVLVMTVEPGFGGQKFRPEMMDKIRALRAMGYQGMIEADGGISRETLPALHEAGLSVAVLGTGLYKSENPKGDIAFAHAL